MSNLVNIKVHGVLAEQLGQSEWNLAAKNVSQAVRGVECNSKKLYKSLLENDKKNIKYRVLINKKDFQIEEGKDPNTIEGLKCSELAISSSKIETIDIVPVIEGSDDFMSILTIIIGVALIAVGGWGLMGVTSMGAGGAMGTALVLGGIGLVAAGITNLLTPMPEFGDFNEIERGGAKAYLFNGPENTVREGGPVFVGYGRLLVGSHVIQSASDVVDASAEIEPKDTWGETKYGLLYNIPNAGKLLKAEVDNWGTQG